MKSTPVFCCLQYTLFLEFVKYFFEKIRKQEMVDFLGFAWYDNKPENDSQIERIST